MTTDPGSELVDVLDDAGRPIGRATRREMRERRLPHRCVYILVFNRRGEPYVHLRTPTKDVYPSHWDVAVGGVLAAGETFDAGAERELAEELGVTAPLTVLFPFRYEDAARLRDRIAALEQVVRDLQELDRLRATNVCLLVPAVEQRYRRALFVSGGRIAAARTLPPGPGARVELEAGLAEVRAAQPSQEPEDADELLLVGSFLRRPPPELEVVGLDELTVGYRTDHGSRAMAT